MRLTGVLRLLVGLAVLAVACSCSSEWNVSPQDAEAASTTTTSPPVTTRPASPRVSRPNSTASLADRICAEIEDPSFDTRPLWERRNIRTACREERELEAQEDALRDSGALDPPYLDEEPPDLSE